MWKVTLSWLFNLYLKMLKLKKCNFFVPAQKNYINDILYLGVQKKIS